MPTVLFVSASLSLLLATDPDSQQRHERSRKDIMQLMILHLLKKLPDRGLVTLYEFSAHETQCSVPFTDDHSAIRRRIYQMSLHERGPLGPALEKLVDDLAYTFPQRTKIQVVLFTDGRLLHGWEYCRFRPIQASDPDALEDLAMENFCAFVQKVQERSRVCLSKLQIFHWEAQVIGRYSIYLNVVCLGNQNDADIIKNPYHRLASSGNGHLCFVELPNANVKSHIDKFYDDLFPVYTGYIRLGLQNLLSVRAEPDPNTVAWDAGYEWQCNLPIKGFIQNCFASYSLISRHSLYSVDSSDAYTKLALALHLSDRVAIVELNSKRNWLGLLRRMAPNSLILDVLEPGAVLPSLQSDLFSCNFLASSNCSVPKDLSEPSYMMQFRRHDYVNLNHDAVLRDFSKLAKLIQTARLESTSEMSSICSDIRKRADRFFCPSLLSALVAVLNGERESMSQDMQVTWLEPMLLSLQNNS